MALINFKFKPITTIKKPRISKDKKKSKLLYCLCSEDGEDYIANVNTSPSNTIPKVVKYRFTEKSYNIKGKTVVFSKYKDEHGCYIKYLRDESESKIFPLSSELYTPFRKNYVYSGYIVEINGVNYFDVVDCIDHISNCYSLVNFNL